MQLLGAAPGPVDWLFLAGVNAHTLGQQGRAMTYCNAPQRGNCSSPSSSHSRQCACRTESVDMKGSGVKKNADMLKNKLKGIFLMQTLICNDT